MNLDVSGLDHHPILNHILQQVVTAPRENYTLLCSPLRFFVRPSEMTSIRLLRKASH